MERLFLNVTYASCVPIFSVPSKDKKDKKHTRAPSGDEYTLVVKNYKADDQNENSAPQFLVPNDNHQPGE